MNKFLLGDCLELLPSIPDKSVDMILCDLPYGTTACEWDSIIDMGRLWAQYERVIKDNGAIVLTANAVFTFQLWESNKKLFRYRWIWRKNTHTGFLLAKKQPLRNFEDVLIFYKSMPIYNPQKTIHTGRRSNMRAGNKNNSDVYGISKRSDYEDDGTRYPIDILEFSNVMQGSIHPTQKPVSLFEYLIKTYSNENEVVLDNCAGSGTTAIACINTNRRYICMEQNKEYYDKAINRINNHEPLLQLIGIDK